MAKLLVIDDEESVRYSFRYVFEEDGVEVLTAGTGAEGLEQLQLHDPDVVVLDLQLPDRSGLDVFQDLHTLAPKTPVIFITAHGTTDTAIEAMKNGAFDYMNKPVDLDRLSQILGRAFEAVRLMRVPAVLPVQDNVDRIVGRSPVMQEMCKIIGRVAPQDVNVLILGESGTGKELVARALYQHSKRADRPFLAINCAAIPENLLESELFGHEQGAFTGATRRHIGKFEQCNNGTLFLDEIGDMSPALQSKMLRVLQEQRFERIGGHETLQTRVRILAATNRNLLELADEGQFRKDLYYRLKGVTVDLPPLRERLSDVAELAHYFLFRFNQELHLEIRGLSPDLLEALQAYDWPGNVRELQGAIKQAMLRATGPILLPEFLPEDLRVEQTSGGEEQAAAGSFQNMLLQLVDREEGEVYARAVEALDRILLPAALRHTQGHQTQAAELLGISRGTLRQKLRHLGLGVDKVVSGDSAAEESNED
ncbi:MAG: sigma-54-dependent transcriptional regulator [Gemmataceae bacterium]